MTEKQLQTEIIKFLKSHKMYVIKCQAGPGIPTGCPDILALAETEWIAIEVKREANSSYQPLQRETIKRLKAMNPYVYVVHNGNWQQIKDYLTSYFSL